MDTRPLARILLLLVAVAAVAGTWVAIQPPDDLTRLPTEPAALRLGPLAAEAAQRCREALARERPMLDANSIALHGIVPATGDREPGALRVEGSFRDTGVGGTSVVRHFRCTAFAATVRSVEIIDPAD